MMGYHSVKCLLIKLSFEQILNEWDITKDTSSLIIITYFISLLMCACTNGIAISKIYTQMLIIKILKFEKWMLTLINVFRKNFLIYFYIY